MSDAQHLPMRASDADRESVAKLLDEAYTDGRLTRVEHADRIGQALQATTIPQLQELVADLGPAPPLPAPATMPPPMPVPPISLPTRQDVRSLLSNVRREGPWLVPAHLHVELVVGDATLDMREATFESTDTQIEVWLAVADLKLIVPDGFIVLNNTTHLLGDAKMKGLRPPLSGQPIITLRGVLLVGNLIVLGPDARLRGRDRWNTPPTS